MKLEYFINKSFDYLDENYETKWSSTASTREKLIKAFSQTEISVSEFLGYKTGDGLRHTMKRAIISPKPNKPASKEWRDWLLENIGYFLCRQCNEVIPLINKIPKQNCCTTCDNDTSKNKRLKKRKFVYSYLLDHPCVDCGESDPITLEFDHLDSSLKEHSISNMMGMSIEKIKLEISKCEVVCANCHRKRTAKTYNWYNFIK